ncbi:MAG: winged helix-turn-helix transcriptional regulator [Hamadaea sp.]|nr:winged helix-turn-helix transcriptional regulator [Hamadaea sp.]
MQTRPSPHPDHPLSAETSTGTGSGDDTWPATAARPPLAVLLRDGFRWFTDRLNATAVEDGEPGISAAAAMVISYLHPEGSRPAEIARAMGVSRQHVHTVSRELTDAGILTTTPDPHSRRDRLLVPTPAGEQRRRRALAHLAGLEAELAQRLDPGEFDQLRELLTRLWTPSAEDLPSRAPRE